MDDTVVSVIIPTCNRAHFITEAVESVLSQTYASWELLVVDDGSTDNTAAVLARFGSRITTIRSGREGPGAARNKGIRAARGDFIAFLDSDDVWRRDKLAEQVDFFYRNPEAAICQTDEIWIRNGVRVNPRKKHRKHSGWIFERCLPLCVVSPSAVMIHRKVFERVGLFDESMPACEDYDLWLRIAPHYPIHLIGKPLVVKRGGHPDQQSRVVPALDRFRIRALCKSLDSGDLSAAQFGRALDMLEKKCAVYGNGCLKRGKKDEAEGVLRLPQRYRRRFGRQKNGPP